MRALLIALSLAAVACADAEATDGVLLTIVTADDVERAEYVTLDWTDRDTVLLRDVRVPRHGAVSPTGPRLATIFIATDQPSGVRRAVARGLRGAAVVSEGEATVNLAPGKVQAQLELRARSVGDAGAPDAPPLDTAPSTPPDAGAPDAPIDMAPPDLSAELGAPPPPVDTAPPPDLGAPVDLAADLRAPVDLAADLRAPVDLAPPARGPNLLRNGTFDRGTEEWTLQATAPATASWSVVDRPSGPALRLDVGDAGSGAWQLGLYQTGVATVPGRYVATFFAQVTAGKTIEVMLQRSVAPYPALAFKTVTLDPATTTYRVELTMDASDPTVTFRINFGNNTISVVLDDLVLSSP